MGFDTLVRSGVAIANSLTKSLQASITIAPWAGQNGFGTDVFGDPVSYSALVDFQVRPKLMSSGRMELSIATVTILTPAPLVVADNRVNPIDTRDILTLPDGSQPNIIEVEGFVDPLTNLPYMLQLWLGERRP